MAMEERSPKDGTQSSAGAGNVYLLSYGFNQEHSCFVCGTTAGFRVYTAKPVSEVHRRENSQQSSAFSHRSVALISMLFKTNIFAMVTVSDDDPSSGLNKVQIWDDQKGKFVGELRSRNEVKGVYLRRDIIAMVCEYAIYVYTCDKLKVILHLTTNANSRGLCVLAPSSDPWILACPGQSTGAVRIQVGQDDRATHVFSAHQSGLACLALNASGTLVATASEQGTVVKVFQSADGQLLYRLRRSARPANISCLTFRWDDRFLAVASSSSTVHIFKLDPATATGDGEQASPVMSPVLGAAADPAFVPPLPETGGSDSWGTANPTLQNVATQIQKAVTKVAAHAAPVMPRYFNDLRSFAQFRIPDMDSPGSLDARSRQSRILGPTLAFDRTDARLLVLHYSGVLYECSFRPDHDPGQGTQDCGFVCATTWFATRPDFRLQGPCAKVATVAGGAAEGDEDAEEWQLL